MGFSQADVAIRDTLVLHRALQYAATFGYRVWLRPSDAWLGKGVAALPRTVRSCGKVRVRISAASCLSVSSSTAPVSGVT